ncbi:7TM diverse intracellular signaling domain-containing protein [Croceiramulus getboli]|nr:7TM diverse intracellular signaling domain-containing protein [Flavobacteriaceae bacterium YJPT1-3]
MRIATYICAMLASCFLYAQDYGVLRDQQDEFNAITIQEADFEPLLKENRGTVNGTYWFKIDSIPAGDHVIEIRTSHLNTFEIYDAAGDPVATPYKSNYPAYLVRRSSSPPPYYIKAQFDQEAYFPIAVTSEADLAATSHGEMFGFGLFYGTVLFVILINLLFFSIFKDRTFLFYGLLLFVAALCLAFRDNLFYLFDLEGAWTTQLELFIHASISFIGGLFAVNYLKLYNQFPKLRFIVGSLCVISFSLAVLYAMTEQYPYFVASDISTFIAIAVIWITGIYVSKSEWLYFMIILVYALNVYLVLDFFVLHNIGLNILDVSPLALKIGILLDMILLTYSIVYNMQIIRVRNRKLRRELASYHKKVEALSSYAEITDVNDDYLETLIEEYNLTNKEVKVLQYISEGESSSRIAERLQISTKRLMETIESLYEKLGVESLATFTSKIA